MATAIPAIRQVLKSLEKYVLAKPIYLYTMLSCLRLMFFSNAIAFSIRLINNGGWDRFITQYKERQPDIHTQNKLFR